MSLKDPNVANPKKTKRIAVVLANPAVSTTTGWPVGFWWSELTHPYFVLTEKGYEVEIFSPNGGKCEADAVSDPRDASGYSSSDLISLGFLSTPDDRYTNPATEHRPGRDCSASAPGQRATKSGTTFL
jgi:putative intracellular protease/amidase